LAHQLRLSPATDSYVQRLVAVTKSAGYSLTMFAATNRLTTCRSSIYGGRVEFRTPSYFALAALIDGPLHGYAIVQRATTLSDGAVNLSTGTLYALLDRAIEEGLVEGGEPYVERGRRRRDYRLTPPGRAELEAETVRLARAATVVQTRLRATGRMTTRAVTS
jgi:PadR family transcriptional regulator